MMKRKIIFTCLICFLAVLFVACNANDGGENTTDTSEVNDNGGETDTTDDAGTANEEFFEFEFYANYEWFDTAPVWGNDLVSAYMRDRFNIGVRLSSPDIDADQMMGIMIAAGDLPDVMMIERDSVLQQLVELDLLLPLDEFLPGSNYANAIDESTINLARIDGQVYGMLNWPTNVANGNGGWIINRSIWEELGEPPLETTDQILDYLIMVRDANITVDGAPIVPMQFGHSEAIYQLTLNSFGINMSDNGLVENNGSLELYLNMPEAEDALLWLNTLWNEGLINSDHFVESSEQITEKMATGRFAVYAGHDVAAAIGEEVRPVFLENNPDNEFMVINPPAAPGVATEDVMNSRWSSLGWNKIVITRNAENPERIFELLDFIVSREGQTLTYHGPQGELWDELDADGFPILNRTTDDLTVEERENLGGDIRWTLVGDAGNTALMDRAVLDRIPRDQWSWRNTVQQDIIWNHSLNVDAFLNMHLDTLSSEGIALNTFMDLNEQHIPNIVTASNHDAARAAIQTAIDAIYSQNFELVEEALTEVWRNNIETMSGN